jgi:hypothetical protein
MAMGGKVSFCVRRFLIRIEACIFLCGFIRLKRVSKRIKVLFIGILQLTLSELKASCWFTNAKRLGVCVWGKAVEGHAHFKTLARSPNAQEQREASWRCLHTAHALWSFFNVAYIFCIIT